MEKETTKVIADRLIDANMRFDVITIDDRFEVKIYNKDKKTFWFIYPFANTIFVELRKIGDNVLVDDIVDSFNFDYDEFCEGVHYFITAIIGGYFSKQYRHHKTFVCEVCGEVHKYSDIYYNLADIDGTVLTDKYICHKCSKKFNPYKVFDKIGLVPAYTSDSMVDEIKTYDYVKHMID